MSRLEELIKKLCPNGVEYKKIEALGTLYGGLNGKSREDFKDGNAHLITYTNVFNNPELRLDLNDTVKISSDEKQRKLKYCDIIFTGSSETPEEVAFSSVITRELEEDYYLNSFCFFLRLNDCAQFNPHFLKHLMRSSDMRNQFMKTASGVTRFNVSKKMMMNVQVPVPPLPIQQRIVNILDKFDEYCNDLTKGLPAEIEMRHKQYEYYRDKLLTFKRLEK